MSFHAERCDASVVRGQPLYLDLLPHFRLLLIFLLHFSSFFSSSCSLPFLPFSVLPSPLAPPHPAPCSLCVVPASSRSLPCAPPACVTEPRPQPSHVKWIRLHLRKVRSCSAWETVRCCMLICGRTKREASGSYRRRLRSPGLHSGEE